MSYPAVGGHVWFMSSIFKKMKLWIVGKGITEKISADVDYTQHESIEKALKNNYLTENRGKFSNFSWKFYLWFYYLRMNEFHNAIACKGFSTFFNLHSSVLCLKFTGFCLNNLHCYNWITTKFFWKSIVALVPLTLVNIL